MTTAILKSGSGSIVAGVGRYNGRIGLRRAWARYRADRAMRAELRTMSDRQLRDIGLAPDPDGTARRTGPPAGRSETFTRLARDIGPREADTSDGTRMAQTLTYGADARGATGWIARLRKSIADYRLYRRTLEELRGLSDRELRDLGLPRFDIRQVAHDSVYGA